MRSERFMREVRRIFRTVFVQKALTVFLRSAWLGGAAYLLCWGANRYFGWFPNQSTWVTVGVFTMVVVFLTVFLSWRMNNQFVWRLDQKYGLDQQLFTAYENLAERKEPEAVDDPGLETLLESEAVAQLPSIRRSLTDSGWNIRNEIESTVVILILLLLVFLLGVGNLDRIPPGFGIGLLPGLGTDPSANEVFGGGIPGNPDQGDSSGDSETGVSSGAGDGSVEFDPENWPDITETLEDLGDDLSDEAGTSDLGEALSNQDFEQAATEFGSLAEDIEDYSPESREKLAQQLLETAVELQDLGEPDLSEPFSEAAESLFGDNASEMAEDLDQLSELMQELDEFDGDQQLVEVEEEGGAPIDPLADNQEAQALVLDALGDVDLFSSGVSAQPGEDLGISDTGGDLTGAEEAGESIWLPFDLSQDDTDVVSSYFSPR
jgi:hypothetical protein